MTKFLEAEVVSALDLTLLPKLQTHILLKSKRKGVTEQDENKK